MVQLLHTATWCTYYVQLKLLHCDVYCSYFSQQFILQDMELYRKHVVLYGLKALLPFAIIIDAYIGAREPKIVVSTY